MENNFFYAYYETFNGNEFLNDDWKSYLSMVYIHEKGNVKNFNRQRSLEKFYAFVSDADYARRLKNKLALIIRSREGIEFELYSQFASERDVYLDARGDRYRYIYAV